MNSDGHNTIESTFSDLAASIDAELLVLTEQRTPLVRPIRQKYSKIIAHLPPEQVIYLTQLLIIKYNQRGFAYELLANHKSAMHSLDATNLEALGQGINSWWSVDTFARLLSGPAWVNHQVTDNIIQLWAGSPDLWWRRAALVSTVAFNMRSQGGRGDTARTLAICRLLACDREDMVVKALSWALRELIWHDRPAVEEFLHTFDYCLSARVKRETHNKLELGLINPRRR